MIKNYNTNAIFKIKKVAFLQLILGTFMVSAVYAKNTTVSNSINTAEEFKIENKTGVAVEKITGQVVDEQGVSLPGVNVYKKGTKTGVSTDLDGNFTIDANKGEVLVFSYLGFLNQEIQIRDNKILKIVLKSEAQQMNEVVVVGYGSQKKTNLTGSVTQIDSKVLQDRPITRLSQGLQGAVGGLNIISNGGAPNATQSINIRGFTGLGTSGSPLVVIDGIQGGDINSINANDVESVSVIKDAAASAVYGSSAPYGVILIKTKQGKKGQPVSITYNNNFTFDAPIGLPKMLNSLDFAKIYNQSLANGGGAPFFNQDAIDRMTAYQNGTLTTETVANTTGDSYKAWGGANANNDWFKIYFKDISLSQQHNIGVSGATDNSNYYVGLGYNKKEGMYRYGDDNYKRYNLRANLSSNLTEWLTFNFRGAFSQDIYDTPNTYAGKTGGNYMHQIGRKHPNLALYNPDGGISDESDILLLKDGGRNIVTNDKPIFTGEFVSKFTKNWTGTVNYTFDGAFNNQTNHVKTLYTALPSGTLREVGGTAPNGFARYFSKYQKNIINAFTSYDLDLNKHQFKFLGGYVQELTTFSALSGSNNNLYSDKIPSISTSYGATPSVSDNAYKLAIQGYFGRINYSYDDKYLVEVTGRYDGSSRFLKDVRWKAYPGVSVGWNVNKESFWSENIENVVNTLKFRASYGSLGAQDPDLLGNYPFYPSLGTVSPTSSNWFFGPTRQPYVNTPGLVDPTLTWVTTTTRNFGVDASFLNRRLTAVFDMYTRKMDDYIGPAQELPGILGISAPRTNSTALETKGFELTLAWHDNIGDFKYGVRGVLSDYKGRVTKYPNPNKLLNTWYEGQQMGEIWGFVTDRYFTAEDDLANVKQMALSNWSAGDIKYKDLNGDGDITWGNSTVANPGDRKVIGNSTPRYSYSFFTDGSYKGFDYSIFIQGVGKRDYYTTSNMYFGIVGSEWQSSLFTEHLDRWTPENPNGFFPKAYIGGGNWWKNTEAQTKYLINAAYLRIKNVQIGYTLPAAISNQVKIQKLRFYISADNLGTFTKMNDHSVLDPENTFSDAKNYPLQRSISVGANITL
ncbi:SusC/RagA family TonB-linked outer membrane protein [Flavobacterium granuli]|uniref:TonB-linked SusC/RagA family outer membrane protein n=1 Tax=Flavobacterium granuli TaxID=280093 RepID=A0A1M5IX52_9FLAO|nr:TonB-dependent receptor [Flavobacterium granuli]PRZ28146.1 TonB-linked SusC/RagA family outer membrane protein [Flavobacterium granuli]SHG32912.1 TonB-linked outer membrane protein, SusC/RagA family [Flavobacterium granuli]